MQEGDGLRLRSHLQHPQVCLVSPSTRCSHIAHKLTIRSRTINGFYRTYASQGDSGNKADQVFCPTCGSGICGLPQPGHPRENFAYIKSGTLDAETRKTLAPQIELFCESKLPFIKESFGKQFQTTPPVQSG
jgi:hypothetical protein